MAVSKVGVIVLNWNRPEDTLECLDSLQSSVKEGITTIICRDNSSTDNSIAAIRGRAKQH